MMDGEAVPVNKCHCAGFALVSNFKTDTDLTTSLLPFLHHHPRDYKPSRTSEWALRHFNAQLKLTCPAASATSAAVPVPRTGFSTDMLVLSAPWQRSIMQ